MAQRKHWRNQLDSCGIFPDIESLSVHASSDAHKSVVELTPKVCDWMTVDTVVF